MSAGEPGGRVPRSARFILRAAARIVPPHQRDAWRRQWAADLEHLCRRPDGPRHAVRYAAGSLRHAVWRRGVSLRPAGGTADVRLALRGLGRRPAFTALAVLTLAVGIGAATAVFSLAEAMIFRPMPVPDGERLVRVFSTNPVRGMSSFSVSFPDYRDLVRSSGLFESSALYDVRDRDVSGEGPPERVRVIPVGDGFFETLRPTVLAGRVLGDADQAADAPKTAVLSEAFWVRRFGGDPGAVGRTIRLDGVPHDVVGVIAHGHGWPAGADLWTPLQWGGVPPSWVDVRANHTWQVVGRIVPDVSIDDASLRVREQARAVYAGDDIDPRDVGTEAYVVSLRASAGGDTAAEILTTMGVAVMLVLLIACLNASGLLLTRAWDRARELSVRSALGAGRARLVGSLLAESVVLALLGGGVGVLLGVGALRRGLDFAAPEISAISDVRLNPWVLAAGLAISLLAALLSGLAPALRATRQDVAESLREGSSNAAGGRGATRLRRGLIVAEVALSLTLLVGAALTVRALQGQLSSDPGFDPDGLLSFTVRLPAARYGETAVADAFWTDAVARLEAHPAVRAASAVSKPPLGAPGASLYRAFVLDGQPEPPEGTAYDAQWIEVDPRFFVAVGIDAREGRLFTEEDDADGPPVAIVNRSMSDLVSPGASVVGRGVTSVYDERLERTVVGVVPDIQIDGQARARSRPVVYVPRSQAARREMAFLVRTDAETGVAVPAVRAAIGALDPDVALDRLQTLREAQADDLGGLRFVTALFGAFGVLALGLSLGGVYGLVSFAVTRRTREIGMRFAMGATAGTVHRGLLEETARLALLGVALGSGLAYAGARVLEAGLGDQGGLDAVTFVSVVGLMLFSVALATWIPARRVSTVDPARALRTD